MTGYNFPACSYTKKKKIMSTSAIVPLYSYLCVCKKTFTCLAYLKNKLLQMNFGTKLKKSSITFEYLIRCCNISMGLIYKFYIRDNKPKKWNPLFTYLKSFSI